MKKIGIAANTSKIGVFDVVQETCNCLHKLGAETFLEAELARTMGQEEKSLDEIEVLLIVGGDGTILRYAGWAMQTGIPLLGINLGHVGFLNNIELNDLQASLSKLVNDEYTLLSRSMLEGVLHGKKYYALNDILLFKKHFSNTIDVQVDINDVKMTGFACDGLLVSTPVGSTAYSLSAGGPIVSPNVNAVLITPVCAHTLSARPMLVSESDQLTLRIREGHCSVGMVIIDGNIHERELREEEQMKIRLAEKAVHFIAVNDYNFFELVRKKLY